MDFIFGFLANTWKHFDYFSHVIELNSLALISAPILLASMLHRIHLCEQIKIMFKNYVRMLHQI